MSQRESSSLDTYYRDHWVDIEPERMSRYEAMFQWREGHEALIAPADIVAGQTVADYGCGPGGLTLELARRVGESGSVIGLDINPAFLERTRKLAEQHQLADRIATKLIEDDLIPLSDRAVDRILCKNVLEYVPDPTCTIAEFYRVLKPGGIAHVTDSDWGAVIFEPSGEPFARIMDAAAVAFRTPLIGRRLYGMFRSAGFSNIQVQVLTSADTSGALRPVLTNMASYARLSGKLEESKISAFLGDMDRALEDGTYLALLPQFLVTGQV